MQIRLFHLQNSRSQRIVWFLEELGLPYELVINHHSDLDEKKNSDKMSCLSIELI